MTIGHNINVARSYAKAAGQNIKLFHHHLTQKQQKVQKKSFINPFNISM